jgi:branched-subunit amino acid ABC-type transport system permease component
VFWGISWTCSCAQLLTGLAYASTLFLVAAGLTIIFGVTRVVNFAHGSLYMLGAYLGLHDHRRAAAHAVRLLRRPAAGRAWCGGRRRG